jgi:hypothetical protein
VFHGQTGIAEKDIMDVVMTTIARKYTYTIITTFIKNTPVITAADHIGYFTTPRVCRQKHFHRPGYQHHYPNHHYRHRLKHKPYRHGYHKEHYAFGFSIFEPNVAFGFSVKGHK